VPLNTKTQSQMGLALQQRACMIYSLAPFPLTNCLVKSSDIAPVHFNLHGDYPKYELAPVCMSKINCELHTTHIHITGPVHDVTHMIKLTRPSILQVTKAGHRSGTSGWTHPPPLSHSSAGTEPISQGHCQIIYIYTQVLLHLFPPTNLKFFQS